MEQTADHVTLFLAYLTVGGGLFILAAATVRAIWKLMGGEGD